MNQLNYDDYPSLFKVADKYSIEGQKRYLQWIRFDLLLLVLAAIISIFNFDNVEYQRIVYILVALFFFLGLLVNIFIKISKFEDDWYIGRAIAESIKSLTWKYIIRGEPFGSQLSQIDVDKKFENILSQIFETNGKFLKDVFEEDNRKNISEEMKEIRASDFENRKQVYFEHRVKNQFSWYKNKALYNKKQTSLLFWLIIFLQGVALLYSLYLIRSPQAANLFPIVTTVAACLISWLQIKQHQELSQSYAVTANEIAIILNQADSINTDDNLAAFVIDSENAFSREHTLWMARRDAFSYSIIDDNI